ncbi:heme-binding protein [Algoriphagus sp.]|uniref:GlcG/HbpS family heme-binding protein n=1 Tax=Algoriphagus sp. TaxID=1872435 RepID=UPI0025DD5A44|nr:heme-binding protein [Algoriphagus sp.]
MKNVFFFLLVILSFNSISKGQTQPYLDFETATYISDAAQKKAVEEGWNMVIVILDGGGNLISLRRMDGVQIGSIDVAIAKAKSAVYFKRPTKVFEDAMKSEGGGRIATLPNIVAVEGGLPIFKDGICIGSIGISGATSPQDGIVAAAGISVIE